MMLPIERAGTLVEVRGRDDALAVEGIVGLEITVPVGRTLTPLPDGDRYLGFLFARAETPAAVEGRAAGSCGAASLWSSREGAPRLDLRARSSARRGRRPGRAASGRGARGSLRGSLHRHVGSGPRRLGRQGRDLGADAHRGAPGRARWRPRSTVRSRATACTPRCAPTSPPRWSAATRTPSCCAGSRPIRLGRPSPRRRSPARDLLPPLERYARLIHAGQEHLVASVEASRGCAHRCRHCPVPVVYDGRIQINPVDAVVADVAQQVAIGARARDLRRPRLLQRRRTTRSASCGRCTSGSPT